MLIIGTKTAKSSGSPETYLRLAEGVSLEIQLLDDTVCPIVRFGTVEAFERGYGFSNLVTHDTKFSVTTF